MGVFTSALDGAIEGARQAVMNNLQTENAVLKRYVKLLSFGANFYRALAEGQTVVAVRDYGNYHAAREVMKKYCNMYPESDKDFIPLKKKFAEEIVKEKYKAYKKIMAEHGYDKAYATTEEIYHDRMDFITPEQVLAKAMGEQVQNPAPNYVTSPFGSTAPQEEKKKEKGSWFFGKK